QPSRRDRRAQRATKDPHTRRRRACGASGDRTRTTRRCRARDAEAVARSPPATRAPPCGRHARRAYRGGPSVCEHRPGARSIPTELGGGMDERRGIWRAAFVALRIFSVYLIPNALLIAAQYSSVLVSGGDR